MKTLNLKSLWLMLLMLCASVSVFAYDFEVDGIYYNITSEEELTVEVTYKADYSWSGNSYYGDVSIPTTVLHDEKIYSVTSIGDHAFYESSGLTSIEIPSSVASISEGAFFYCI